MLRARYVPRFFSFQYEFGLAGKTGVKPPKFASVCPSILTYNGRDFGGIDEKNRFTFSENPSAICFTIQNLE